MNICQQAVREMEDIGLSIPVDPRQTDDVERLQGTCDGSKQKKMNCISSVSAAPEELSRSSVINHLLRQNVAEYALMQKKLRSGHTKREDKCCCLQSKHVNFKTH